MRSVLGRKDVKLRPGSVNLENVGEARVSDREEVVMLVAFIESAFIVINL